MRFAGAIDPLWAAYLAVNDLGAQLLRRDERVVHRLLALLDHGELLVHPAQPLLQRDLLAHHPLQLVGHAAAEVLHLEGVVAAHRLLEVEGGVAHPERPEELAVREPQHVLLDFSRDHDHAIIISEDDVARLDPHAAAFAEENFEATPLWYAIAFGENLAQAGYLLERGSDPNHCLWAAVNRDNAAAIRLLIAHGAEDPTNEEGSPLLAAVQWNKFAAAEELLKLGADVNFQDSKRMTALHYLLKKRSDKKYVRMLINYGARGDLKNENGVTAAEIMMRKRDSEFRQMAAQCLARS